MRERCRRRLLVHHIRNELEFLTFGEGLKLNGWHNTWSLLSRPWIYAQESKCARLARAHVADNGPLITWPEDSSIPSILQVDHLIHFHFTFFSFMAPHHSSPRSASPQSRRHDPYDDNYKNRRRSRSREKYDEERHSRRERHRSRSRSLSRDEDRKEKK